MLVHGPRLACHIWNLAKKHSLTLIPHTYLSIPIGKLTYIPCGRLIPDSSLNGISTLASTWGGLASILTYQSLSALLQFGESITTESLGVECFNHPSLEVCFELCFSYSCISCLVLFRSLTEQITGQLRLLILVAPCWIEALCFPLVVNILEDIPCSYMLVSH